MSCLKEFLYTFKNNEKYLTVNFSVEIPIPDLVSINELAYLCSDKNDIPIYLFEDMKKKLSDFIYDETNLFFDAIGDELIDLQVDDESIAKFWANWYKTTVKEYSDKAAPSDEVIFSKIFTALANSPHVHQLLDIQLAFSEQVARVIKTRDDYLNVLQLRQQIEMEMAMKNLGSLYQDEDINDMAKRHIENIEMAESKYASELSCLAESQQRDYKELCTGLHEQLTSKLSEENADQSKVCSHNMDQSIFEYKNINKSEASSSTSIQSKLYSDKVEISASKSNVIDQSNLNSKNRNQLQVNGVSNQSGLSYKSTNQSVLPTIPVNEFMAASEECSSPREESFTVHIGTQLKTTQNLKFVSCDILDFCHQPAYYNKEDGRSLRLQTLLTLYSFNLKAVVLIVDKKLNTFRGIKKEFALICEKSTDLHFSSLSQQLDLIQQKVASLQTEKPDSIGSSISEKFPKLFKSDIKEPDLKSEINYQSISDLTLQAGDVYITRHSNLSQVHIVYHIVAEDELLIADISSRHPVVPALKNIIRCCFSNDVHDIAIPLLLIHYYTLEMNLNWCLRRAELILKCVKGFVVEMAMRSAEHQSVTVQFIVPKDLPDEIFEALREMIPTIFKMSNPVSA